MIITRRVHFSYKEKSFVFPDISCGRNETLLLTGASGKGKTTLLHLLAGLLRPESGTISIGNQVINTLGNHALDTFRRNHIGIVFQQPYYISSVTVLDNVLLAAKNDTAVIKDKALSLLRQLGIEKEQAQYPGTLSAGQLQRVAIARALLNNPLVLLADEPTSALDDQNCMLVAEMLQEQALKNSAALIVVTHDQRLKDIYPQKMGL